MRSTEVGESASPGLGRDFSIFWTGHTVSSFGSAVTLFALPLLLYELTGSAIDLALGAVAFTLPRLFFGLHIGAWTDRLDRRSLMIRSDLALAAIIIAIPAAAFVGLLSASLIYAVLVISSLVGLLFQASQSGAVPSLVERDALVTANGRIQAGFAAATVLGPLVGGALLAMIPVALLLVIDAASFVLSAIALSLISRPFNAPRKRPSTSVSREVMEGLRYVFRQPVLRLIAVMLVAVNFFAATHGTQLVLFAKEVYGSSDQEVGLLFAAGAVGVIVSSLFAGRVRRHLSLGLALLGSVVAYGLVVAAMGLVSSFVPAVILWAAASGLVIFVRINTASTRQAIAEDAMRGRVESITIVLAQATIPIGTIFGAVLIESTGNVSLVYTAFGLAIVLVGLAFSFTALARAQVPTVSATSSA